MWVLDKLYIDVEFCNGSRILLFGIVVLVKGIEYFFKGVFCLKIEGGYFIVNKNYVIVVGNINNNYFIINLKKVKFLIDDCFYNNIEFIKKG